MLQSVRRLILLKRASLSWILHVASRKVVTVDGGWSYFALKRTAFLESLECLPLRRHLPCSSHGHDIGYLGFQRLHSLSCSRLPEHSCLPLKFKLTGAQAHRRRGRSFDSALPLTRGSQHAGSSSWAIATASGSLRRRLDWGVHRFALRCSTPLSLAAASCRRPLAMARLRWSRVRPP